MRIFFRNTNFSNDSGTDSFSRKLAHRFALDGHTIADEDEYDVCLDFFDEKSFYNDDAKKSKKPFILRVSRIDHSDIDSIKKIKNAYEKSDNIIFQSEFSKKIVEDILGKKSDSIVISNGSENEQQTETLPGFLYLRQQYDKVFVCATSKWNDVHNLEENISLYKKISKGKNYCLVIVGDSPTISIADQKVFYTGGLEKEELLKLFVISDWTINMSKYENCPNTICESISQGTPVICSFFGGAKEIVGKNGIVLKNYEDLDESMLNFDNANLDLSTIDIKNTASKYISFFKRVLLKTKQ